MRSLAHWVLVLAAVLATITPVYAVDLSVLGAWKLLSFAREDTVSGDNTQPWGENPSGCLIYLPDGHMSAVLTAEGRKVAAPADEKQVAQLYSNMAAYAGTYTVHDDTVVHHVEVAWLPGWVGSDQPRQAKLEGETLTIRTQPIRNTADGKDYVYILVFSRAK
jgi:Lipocalin-like domain